MNSLARRIGWDLLYLPTGRLSRMSALLCCAYNTQCNLRSRGVGLFWQLPGRPQARRLSLPCNQSSVNVVSPIRFLCVLNIVHIIGSRNSIQDQWGSVRDILWQASDCRFRNDDGLKARFSTATIHKVMSSRSNITAVNLIELTVSSKNQSRFGW